MKGKILLLVLVIACALTMFGCKRNPDPPPPPLPTDLIPIPDYINSPDKIEYWHRQIKSRWVSDKDTTGYEDYRFSPAEFLMPVIPDVNKPGTTITKNIYVGDCFVGGTMIVVVNKDTKYYELKTINELKDTWKNYLALSYNFEKQSYELKSITNFIERGIKPVKKVWLTNNTSFTCTEDHRLFTVARKTSSYEVKEVRVKELITDSRKHYLDNHFILTANHISPLETYEESLDLLWVKGLYTAEGYSENSHVSIANDNPDIRSKVASILTLHNIPYSNSNRLKHGYQSILSSNFKQELKSLGSNAFNKKFPPQYLSTSEEGILALLEGNIDGDGHRCPANYHYNKKIIYSTSSEKMVNQLFFMNLLVNKPLTIYKCLHHGGYGNQPIWRLYENTNNRQLKSYFNGVGKVGVKRIEDIEPEEVFDITVQDNHNFVLWNGVIAHNCDDFALINPYIAYVKFGFKPTIIYILNLGNIHVAHAISYAIDGDKCHVWDNQYYRGFWPDINSFLEEIYPNWIIYFTAQADDYIRNLIKDGHIDYYSPPTTSRRSKKSEPNVCPVDGDCE